MAIRYVAYTSQGRRVTGTLPVDTPAQAEELLWRSDLIVASLKPERAFLKEARRQLYRQLPTFFRPKATELVFFTRELTTLLHSGIPLHSALRIIQDHTTNPLLKEATAQVGQHIQGGGSFSEAVARHPSVFPALYSRLVTVGEETGRLEPVLVEIANYVEGQAALTRKVTSALRYPIFVALVGLGAAFVITTFSLPALASLFKEYGARLPLTTRMLIGFSDGVNHFGKQALLALGVLAAGLWLYFRTPKGVSKKDALVLKLPVVGRVVRLAILYRFTSSLYTMLNSGLPLVEALELAGRTSGNTQVRAALSRVKEDILAGQSLSQAVSRQALFPSFFSQMVVVGEQSGTLSQNLQTIASFFNQETDRAVTSLTGMIEPTMILVIGGGVGLIALAVMSSLYGIIGQIR